MPHCSSFISFICCAACCTMLASTEGVAQEPFKAREFVSIRVQQAPVIDGLANDPAWSKAIALTTHDPIASTDITLKSVYTADEIFILATYTDPTENRKHKTMIWDPQLERYKIGPHREDTLVIKWNMEPYPVDLTLKSDTPYEADIWYWKAHRTDHAGYADDKHQQYSLKEVKNAKKLLSKMGRRFYLVRKGDQGASAYKIKTYATYVQDQVPLYEFITPEGSRADVKAKGLWQNDKWTIEFSRKLSTGNNDDLQLDPKRLYYFGVSRFEIAGRKPNPSIDQIHFGNGDITEHLLLKFRK